MHFFNTEKLLLAPFFSLDLCFHFIAPIELCGLPRCLNSKESACNAGTQQVQSLDLEDPTCRRATKPVCHNFRSLRD